MAKTARKTIEVGTLLHRVNYFLASDSSTEEEREVMCTFIEGVLFDTHNYRGYRYLDADSEHASASRRRYYVSDRIQEDYAAAAELIEKHYYGRGV
jgi:hypothetical protein